MTDTLGALSRILSATTAVSDSSGSGSASDEETTYYVYGIGLISQEYNGEQLYYHYNNIGSTETVTDSTGAIVKRFEYGPYGELLSENESGIIFLYNGLNGVLLA